MKILFVQSPTGRMEAPIFPLGLACLAGQLSKHDVKGVDLSLYSDFADVLKCELESLKPDIVCISLRNIDDSTYPVTYSYMTSFSEIIEVLEQWKGPLVVGGTGFSIYPEIILDRYPRIDFGLPGEGEDLLPVLLNHIEHGSSIPEWGGGRLLPWGKVDLDAVSSPDYTILDISRYSADDAIGIQSRRGCEFNCTYCTYSYLSGKKFRERPVARILEDIRTLERLGVSRFQFVDSVFNAPDEYFEELLNAIEASETGLSWSAWLDDRITPDQLARMKRSGAVKVDFSPDAISDRGLQRMGKRGKAADLLPAVKAARALGFHVGINFFNGNPGEGFVSLLRKLWFMFRVRLMLGHKETFVNIGTIRVYAHSPIALQMINKGMIDRDCDFFDPVFYRIKGPADWLYRLFQRIRTLRHV